jgi:hypothetical protein
VIELSSSSDEEDFFTDIARDAKFARPLFGDLNHDLLRPSGNDKVIVLNDSDEEEEAHEETAIDANEDLGKMQDDNSDDLAPSQDTGKSSGGGDEAGSP